LIDQRGSRAEKDTVVALREIGIGKVVVDDTPPPPAPEDLFSDEL